MSGRTMFAPPQPIRRGVTLTLVFGAVLATGAAAGSFGAGVPRAPVAGHAAGRSGSLPETAELAAAVESGPGGPAAAARLVARDGGRWSTLYTAAQYAGFTQELDGAYTGVGLWVRATPGGPVTVSRVDAGGPAAGAGIRPGDTLRAVGGTPVAGLAVTDVVARLRGVEPAAADPATAPAPAPGSTVVLRLARAGHPYTVSVRRRLLAAPPVAVSHPRPGVTDIAISAFTRGAGAQVRAALARGGHRRGVLLDLRGDSGGLVAEAVQVASAFLDGGKVATYDEDGLTRTLYARHGGDTATPLVVLVDGGTMSAAELLTGALQDRGRAVVVGARTFGKGTVQMAGPLPGGAVAELTVGRYRTPAGRSVDGTGIRPDVAIAPGEPPATAEKAAETVLSGLGTRS